MNIEQFYKACAQMDWFYDYSDDHSVWTRGHDRYNELRRIAEGTANLSNIYRDYKYEKHRG